MLTFAAISSGVAAPLPSRYGVRPRMALEAAAPVLSALEPAVSAVQFRLESIACAAPAAVAVLASRSSSSVPQIVNLLSKRSPNEAPLTHCGALHSECRITFLAVPAAGGLQVGSARLLRRRPRLPLSHRLPPPARLSDRVLVRAGPADAPKPPLLCDRAAEQGQRAGARSG